MFDEVESGLREAGADQSTVGGQGLPRGALVHGRYEVVRTLGKGGMGAVCLVRDRALGNRLCAMKAMHGEGRTAEERAAAMRRLEPEAEILSRLSHAGIPQVYDRFNEYGRYYLVMEFVAGVDTGRLLERYLARHGRPLPEREVVRWALQICDVLDYLHRHAPPVLHRDLKPANLIVVRGGRVKVVDFGIAKAVTTVRGTTIGTIGYAPPEQYRGQTEERSDLYALGASLHHLLSGRNPQAEAPFDFPRLAALVPGVSPALSELVAELLAGDPSGRPSSARVVAERLAALYPGLDPYRFHAAPDLDMLIDQEMAGELGGGQVPEGPISGGIPGRPSPGPASCTAEITVGNAASLTALPVLTDRMFQVEGLSFAPDGRLLAVSCGAGIWLWRVSDWRPERQLSGRSGAGRIAFSPGGEVLASGHQDGAVQVWRVADGEALLTLRTGGGAVEGLQFSPDGQVLAAAGSDGTVRLWRLTDGQVLRTLPVGRAGACSLAFAPDGALLAGGGPGAVTAWQMNSGQVVRTFRCPTARISALLFSGDGNLLLAGGGDGAVRIWRWADGRPMHTLAVQPGPVRAMAMARRTSLLATGGAQVRLWDCGSGSGRQVRSLQEHRHPVQAIAFAPDDRLMVTGSYEGIRLWGIR